MDEMVDAKSYNQNKHSVDPGKVTSALVDLWRDWKPEYTQFCLATDII